jgi:hypothetical protein
MFASRAAYQAGEVLTAASGRWRRINYRGASVSMAAGPALAATALAAVLADRGIDPPVRRAALIVGATAAVAGALDDRHGSGRVRGLRGHLGALRHGQVTTGVAKLGLIGAAGMTAGAVLTAGRPWRRVLGGGVVAASANMANLLDVRPGRALKAAILAVAPLWLASGSGGRLARLTSAAAAGLLEPDVREQAMLGDTGANCLGALVGVALVADAPPRRLAAVFAARAAATVASEVVSFSRLIDATPPLRWLDRLGRLPPPATDRRDEHRRP